MLDSTEGFSRSAPFESTCRANADFRTRGSARTSELASPATARPEPRKTQLPISCEVKPAVAGAQRSGRREEGELGGGGDRVQRREGGGWWEVVLVRMQKGTTGG